MRGIVLCFLFALAVPALAQAQAQGGAPSAEQMVQQLRTPAVTRSLRNLRVEAAPDATTGAGNANANSTPPAEPAALAPRPSLSLSIQFDFDSARIRPESQQALSNLATALASADLRQSRFVVEGHTDAKGSPEYNRRLSDLRALAVKELLVTKGIDGARLLSVGKGASELANAAAPLAPENRRVKIVNLD